MKKEVIAQKDPKSPISEIFRTLRTNIQFMNTSKKLKVLQVASTYPGEGKSWVTANLAVTFAQAGKKVILIDADMRKGRQYSIFGVSPRPGLSNYLSGIDENETGKDLADYIQETEVENLYIMTAGNVPPNPSELLVSAQMIGLLEEMKELFDIVIVDGTPCELVTDSIIMARLVDSTVIVTAHKATKKDALERAIKNIQNVGGKIAGVVVNKIPVESKKFNERYYYYGETTSRNTNIKRSNIKTINRPTARPAKISENDELKKINNEEKPKALKRDIQIENKETLSLEKTNDILKQINEYLDEEKNKLKKGNDT